VVFPGQQLVVDDHGILVVSARRQPADTAPLEAVR
jgi:hypothetical protein